MKFRQSLQACTVGALAASLTLTACSGERRDSGGGSDAAAGMRAVFSTADAAGPIDEVTWNLSYGEPTSLDAMYAYSDSDNAALANMCESLMLQDEDFSVSPGLAESLEQPDDTTLVFKIRDNVTFWNGDPLTADDVTYSLSRHLDEAAGSYWAVPFYDRVASITTTGDREVTVKLTEPDSLFPRILATAAGVIGQRAFIEGAGKRYGTSDTGVMCTGPFQFASWKPGSSITMTKYDDYWDEDRKALAERLELSFVTDESTITSSLLSGDIDGAHRTPVSGIKALKSSDSGEFYVGASTDWLAIRPTEKDGPFQEVDVRRALSLALDRQAIADSVFQGTAEPSLTPIQPAAWGYSKSTWKAASEEFLNPQVDIDAASKLVSDGGFEGSTITLAYPAGSEAEGKSAELLVDAGKQIGLDIKTVPIPVTTFTSLYFDKAARAKYDAFVVIEYGAGVSDPIVSLSEFTPLSAYNYGELDVPEVTQNVEAALGELDDAKRAELLVKAQSALVDNAGLINVVNPQLGVYLNDNITGATASLAFLYYPWAAGLGAAS